MNINILRKKLIEILKSMGINKIIQSNNLNINFFDDNFDVYHIEDSRTAGYVATGMSVESNETVFIAVGSDNDFRSLAPAITEAFYRNISILVGVFKNNNFTLNFDKDFKDTFNKITKINNMEMLDNIKDFACTFPGLIIFDFDLNYPQNENIKIYSNILENYNGTDFILISHNIDYIPQIISTKYVNNGANGVDGTVSILLGAALSLKYNKYACLITETEIVHDINTLGNRHFPCNDITIFVVEQDGSRKNAIKDYAEALNIEFVDYNKYKEDKNVSKIVWIDKV